MNKKKIVKILALLSLAFAARADAISLESRAIIQEMRNRLSKNAAPEAEPGMPEVVSDVYVPGQQLKSALTRLRANLYGSAVPGRTVELPVRASVTLNFSEKYEPGVLLSRSLEKIRAQRQIKPVGSHVDTVKSELPTPLTGKTDGLSDIESDRLVEGNDDKIYSASEAQPVKADPAVLERKNNSAELLRQVRMKLERKLTHENAVKKDLADEATAQAVPAKREEDLNDEISTYEFKMPSNYRIIVR